MMLNHRMVLLRMVLQERCCVSQECHLRYVRDHSDTSGTATGSFSGLVGHTRIILTEQTRVSRVCVTTSSRSVRFRARLPRALPCGQRRRPTKRSTLTLVTLWEWRRGWRVAT